MSDLQQFIIDSSMPVPEAGCWIWTKSCIGTGYGDFRWQGRHVLAHRASYEAFKGPIAYGKHVLHRCDVRACVNPSHLMLGTNLDNIRDSSAKGRRIGIKRNRPFGIKYKGHSEESREARRKLTPEQRAEVRRLSALGFSQRKLGEIFGVNPATIFNIQHGRHS